MSMTLPRDSNERKEIPMFSGVLKYAPAALAGMARISKAGNDKHNPGEPLHHARGKSNDHADCIVRHLVDVADIEAAIKREGLEWSDKYPTREAQVASLLTEASQLVWRACLLSQELHERYGGAPLAPGARLPELPVGEKAADELAKPEHQYQRGVNDFPFELNKDNEPAAQYKHTCCKCGRTYWTKNPPVLGMLTFCGCECT